MKKIKFSFDYGTSPIWFKNCEEEIFQNGLPLDLQCNIEMVKLFDEIKNEYEKLFINTDIEFSYRGFLNEEEELYFKSKLHKAIDLLKIEANGKYLIEVDYRL